MSESEQEHTEHQGSGIDDDQLPDDLVAGDDNPLAKGLDDGESAGDLLEEGKSADESQDPPSAAE
ncbi:hypothetical protein [Nocardioides sp.]|jgi:hypothetical protein|uniref:hypothetical protein n=1 Tax=Nocardioides sp. TaxID=35761 RepID=UPI001D9EE3AA|nr:hypothetical protein [Nocardioides sp.]MBU1802080.1 hypothetical protein [Actinomycetota bacterium]